MFFNAPSVIKPMSVLSISIITIQFANAEATIQHISQSKSVDLQASSQTTTLTSASSNLFLECATLQTDAARLACYDKVANLDHSAILEPKAPIDLVRTVESSFKELKPTAVLAQNDPTQPHTDALSPSILDGDTRSAQVLQKVGVTREDIAHYTPLSLKYDLDKNSERGVWSPRPHEPMYLMPVFVSFDPNRTPSTPTQEEYVYDTEEYDALELKAQVSVKTKVAEDLFDTNADLWLGYTQQMHWQVYNEDNSRPFRATDYHPEIFLTQPATAPLPFNGRLRMLGAGAIHHSNGQSDPLSRSWNRIYLTGGAEWGNLSIEPRVWAHIKNESDSNPSDNPDITDYYGHGDIRALYTFGRGRTLSATGRYNFSEERGALQLEYVHPFSNGVNGFFQLFHGYGESIVDYNEKTTAIGVGVALDNWKSF